MESDAIVSIPAAATCGASPVSFRRAQTDASAYDIGACNDRELSKGFCVQSVQAIKSNDRNDSNESKRYANGLVQCESFIGEKEGGCDYREDCG